MTPQVQFDFEWGYPATNAVSSDPTLHQLNTPLYIYNPAGFEEEINYQFKQYPNPFSNIITIEYSILKPSIVELELYDAQGKKIETLINEYQLPNKYSVDFNLFDYRNSLYFYKITTADFTKTIKIIRK